ncbi:MAG: hypothetical protein E7139_05455 [Rikenellaceae bacterium]|nr:hypothetical protein [Rikenellaceae bacterium]
MKNIFRILMAVAVLLTASCAKEDISSSIAGGEVEVTFTASLPELSSRAYGDGSQVNTLRYYVYDGNTLLSDLSGEQGIAVGVPTTVNLVLLKGMTYNIVFWADCDKVYNYDTASKSVTVDYAAVEANDEKRDAFYKFVAAFDPATATSEDTNIVLTRPFAQLNAISTDDLTAHNNANITLTTSTVTLDVYNIFNLATGSVDTNSKAPATQLIANNVLDNGLISMNYFFASANESYTTDVTLAVNYSNGASYSRKFTYVPLKQNYRTNIIGQLLSKSTDFKVTIDHAFGKDEPESTYVATIEDLQNAINNAPEGETKIVLGADITGNVTAIQKPNVKIIIDGNNRKFDGTIKVHSKSNYHTTAALTIQNVNFETATESLNFIEALENGAERYSTNITVQNCTFTALATRSAINTAVGVQIKASKNAKVLGCTANNLHSLIQAQSCDESVEVKNCKIYDGKNGVAFKQVKAAVVEGCEINATYYGIRFDGNTDNYGIVVKDNKISAAQPLIIRKMTGQNNTITLEGTNTLTPATEGDYQIVITNASDDEAYVKPTGTYTLTGAEDYVVYPRDYQCPVASWDEFTTALAAGEPKVKLTADITYDANYQLQKSVVINLNGKSMTLPMINIHTTSTVMNGTINGKVYARKNSDITFDNVTFSGAVSDNLSTEGHLSIQSGCKLYAKACLFSPTEVSGSQTKPVSFEGGSSTIKFENCEFKSSPYKKQVYLNSLSATGSVDFTNCNFNNKTPNIMFAANCPLTVLTMSGTTKLSSVTLETNRAKDAVTAEDLAYLREMIANNSISSVRLFYAGGSSEYIR